MVVTEIVIVEVVEEDVLDRVVDIVQEEKSPCIDSRTVAFVVKDAYYYWYLRTVQLDFHSKTSK